MNILHYESKLGRKVSFPGEILDANKFETVCGKILWCDHDGKVYLFGSKRKFSVGSEEWGWNNHPVRFTDADWPPTQRGVYLGRLVTQ